MSWEQSEVFRILKSKPGTQYQEADEEGKLEIRKWVKSLLQVTEVEVEFTKSDGTVRTMRCTLNDEKLPPPVAVTGPVDGIVVETKQRKKPGEESIRVFDLDKNEWRSFRFDRLLKIGATIGFA
jgi:hypothetical protein